MKLISELRKILKEGKICSDSKNRIIFNDKRKNGIRSVKVVGINELTPQQFIYIKVEMEKLGWGLISSNSVNSYLRFNGIRFNFKLIERENLPQDEHSKLLK